MRSEESRRDIAERYAQARLERELVDPGVPTQITPPYGSVAYSMEFRSTLVDRPARPSRPVGPEAKVQLQDTHGFLPNAALAAQARRWEASAAASQENENGKERTIAAAAPAEERDEKNESNKNDGATQHALVAAPEESGEKKESNKKAAAAAPHHDKDEHKSCVK